MSDGIPAHFDPNALSIGERRLIGLLASLPLVSPAALSAVAGIDCQATTTHHLQRLGAAGLVGRLKIATRPGHCPAALYLTDRGLTAASYLLGDEPFVLARRHGLGARALLGLLPDMAHLSALYALLAATCRCGTGAPRLQAWERPWRTRFRPRRARAEVGLSLPGYAHLAWDEGSLELLLLPDLATYPLRAQRLTLTRLAQWGVVSPGPLPTLLIATTDPERAAAWAAMVADARRARGAGPFHVLIVTWATHADEIASRLQPHPEADFADSRISLKVEASTQTKALPCAGRLVGDLTLVRPVASDRRILLGQLALTLWPSDHVLLDTLGRHPFLSTTELGALLGWTSAWAAKRCRRLAGQGLLLPLAGHATTFAEAPTVWEVSAAGLRLIAARQGLSLAAAVRYNGLAGGGPLEPLGNRTSLARYLRHTRGANAVFVSLAATAARQRGLGYDDELEEWRSAAACARRAMRPDGYGIYRHAGLRFGFFLEYDRGNTNRRDYLRKLTSYYDHLARGRHKADYFTFPTVLYVAIDDATERRIAAALEHAGKGRPSLPVLLTTEWRLIDPRNPNGLLGCVWREAREESASPRRTWPQLPAKNEAEPPRWGQGAVGR